MKLFYNTVQFDNSYKIKDLMSPIIAIRLYDEDKYPYSKESYSIGKHKLFSLLTQPIGLIWSEKYHCFVIPDEICLNEQEYIKFMLYIDDIIESINNNTIKANSTLLEREYNQSYYTREQTVKYLQNFLTQIEFNSIILDPCAGIGNLVDGINVDKDKIWLVEPNDQCCDILYKKGYKNVVKSTFEDALEKRLFPKPTHIIMNPPFSKQKDITFFNKAYNLLEDSGKIAAIVSENSIYEEMSRFKLEYDLTIDEIASMFVNDNRISEQMRIFFNNVLLLEPGFVESILTGYDGFGFDGANARAYYVCGKVKKLKK